MLIIIVWNLWRLIQSCDFFGTRLGFLEHLGLTVRDSVAWFSSTWGKVESPKNKTKLYFFCNVKSKTWDGFINPSTPRNNVYKGVTDDSVNIAWRKMRLINTTDDCILEYRSFYFSHTSVESKLAERLLEIRIILCSVAVEVKSVVHAHKECECACVNLTYAFYAIGFPNFSRQSHL